MSVITLKINNVSISNINSNYNEEYTRMKNLDIGKITVINDTNDEAFDVDSEVEVIVDGTSRKFLLSMDDFERVSKSPNTYEHILDLVGLEKYLEGITFPNRKFSQPLDATLITGWTIWDILENLRITAELKLGTDTDYLWTYDTSVIDGLGVSLETYTDGILAREVTLNKPNAREALDQVLAQADMEVQINDFGVVSAVLINNKKNEIDITDVITYKGKQALEQYADKLDLFVENAITENNLNKQAVVYPSTAWSSVRGSGSFLTSDDFIMEVAEPIDRVLKFEVYIKVTSTVSLSPLTETIQVDITELLSEKTVYEGLPYVLGIGAGNAYYDTVARNNSVFYTKGGTTIEGWHVELDKFTGFSGAYFAYRHFLSYAATKAIGGSPVRFGSDFDSGDYQDFMFRLTYIPLQDERLRIERKNPNNSRTLYFNQNERIPDIEKLGSKVGQDIERLGNKELILGKTVTSYNDVFQDGDYYGDYITNKVINNVDKGEIISVAYLSLGAQNIALDVGINTENRDTLIDASKAVVRHELFNEYIIVDSVANVDNTSIMREKGLNRYISTFDNGTLTNLNPIEMVWYKGENVAENLVLQCKSVGASNVIKFDFGFDSPNVAGREAKLVDGLWTSSYIEYVDSDKKVEQAFIYFFGELKTLGGTYSQFLTLSKGLPKLNLTVADTDEIYFDTLTEAFKFKKDVNEILKFTYQISHFSNDEDIFIGDKLSTDNLLIKKTFDQLYIVSKITPIAERQYLLSTDYTAKEEIVTSGATGSQVTVTLFNNGDYASITIPDIGVRNWAIVDENDEVYFIVNDIAKRTIYFNPKNKRSD